MSFLLPEPLKEIFSHPDFAGSKIEVVSVGTSYFVNIYKNISSRIISQSVYTGFSQSFEVALHKAVSEMIERMSFYECSSKGVPCCQTTSSDGFAVLPRGFSVSKDETLSSVRENAYAEAVERYVWATWWDDQTKAKIREMSEQEIQSSFGESCANLIHDLSARLGISRILLIVPEVKDLLLENAIFFVQLEGGGFISGGACGTDVNQVATRALAELYRHGLAWIRHKKDGLTPETFYEMRLVFFASGDGDDLVARVLSRSANSNKTIFLPALQFDCEVEHKHSSSYVSYRCLFENQPPFVGGDLRRLCL